MQTVSALYTTLMADQNHWFETKLVIDGVGEFNETQLFSLSTSTQMFQDTPTVGKAVAQEINVKMLLPSVDIPTMAVLRPYVRVVGYMTSQSDAEVVNNVLKLPSADLENNRIMLPEGYAYIDDEGYIVFPDTYAGKHNSEWLPQGVFYIDTRERTKNNDGLDVLCLHGYDDMLKAEQMYNGRITGDSTDIQMVNEIAYQMGVSVDSRTTTLMTHAYTVPLPTGYTYREILGYIASMYVGGFIMTEEGKLRLVSLLELPPETNYLIDQDFDAITFGGDRIIV